MHCYLLCVMEPWILPVRLSHASVSTHLRVCDANTMIAVIDYKAGNLD